MRPPHDFSLAQPKRLFVDHDEDGVPFHVLAGEPVRDGTLLLLELIDGTWIPRSFHTDPLPSNPTIPWAPPRFRVYLANPLATTRSPTDLLATAIGSTPRDSSESEALTVEFNLPTDAVLRVHPTWKRMMNPRPARTRRRRPTP